MKTFLVIAAVFGMTSSAALADCADHVTASAGVDTEIITASIAMTTPGVVAPAAETLRQDINILKGERLPSQPEAEITK